MGDLASVLGRIVADLPEFRAHNERYTRWFAIDPVLEALGWNLRDPSEFKPEYRVGDGLVDYCLQIGGRSVVFVEAKRTGTEFGSKEDDQLLLYAYRESVRLAALTDGIRWWLYLPRRDDATWEERRFCTIDVERDPLEHAVEVLTRYLGREAVTSGDAVKLANEEIDRAEEERNRRKRVEDVERALPAAWARLLSGPDEGLMELVSDKVEEIAQARPEEAQLRAFLSGVASSAPNVYPATSSIPSSVSALGSRSVSSRPPRDLSVARNDRQRPMAYVLDGVRHEVGWGVDILIGVSNELMAKDPTRFAEIAPTQRGPITEYFNRSGETMRAPGRLASGWYVEKHGAVATVVKRARNLLRAMRGDDSGLEIINRP